jgi:hypothetical protein
VGKKGTFSEPIKQAIVSHLSSFACSTVVLPLEVTKWP